MTPWVAAYAARSSFATTSSRVRHRSRGAGFGGSQTLGRCGKIRPRAAAIVQRRRQHAQAPSAPCRAPCLVAWRSAGTPRRSGSTQGGVPRIGSKREDRIADPGGVGGARRVLGRRKGRARLRPSSLIRHHLGRRGGPVRRCSRASARSASRRSRVRVDMRNGRSVADVPYAVALADDAALPWMVSAFLDQLLYVVRVDARMRPTRTINPCRSAASRSGALGTPSASAASGNGEQAAHQSVDVSSPSARSIRASRALTPREGAGVTSGGAYRACLPR